MTQDFALSMTTSGSSKSSLTVASPMSTSSISSKSLLPRNPLMTIYISTLSCHSDATSPKLLPRLTIHGHSKLATTARWKRPQKSSSRQKQKDLPLQEQSEKMLKRDTRMIHHNSAVSRSPQLMGNAHLELGLQDCRCILITFKKMNEKARQTFSECTAGVSEKVCLAFSIQSDTSRQDSVMLQQFATRMLPKMTRGICWNRKQLRKKSLP